MGIAARCRRACNSEGQMTIELAVAFPVLIVVALIATNAVLFFSECAAFDRIALQAVRVEAVSPGYGQTAERSSALVKDQIASQMKASYLEVDVSCEATGLGLARYTAALEFTPTLFGMGLRSEAFGVSLPRLHHQVSCVVDPYKPGVIA